MTHRATAVKRARPPPAKPLPPTRPIPTLGDAPCAPPSPVPRLPRVPRSRDTRRSVQHPADQTDHHQHDEGPSTARRLLSRIGLAVVPRLLLLGALLGVTGGMTPFHA